MSADNPEWTLPEDPLIGAGIKISGWKRKGFASDNGSWKLDAEIEQPDLPGKRVNLSVIHEWIKPLADYFGERPEVKELFLGFVADTARKATVYSNATNRISPDDASFKVPQTLDSYKIVMFTKPEEQQR